MVEKEKVKSWVKTDFILFNQMLGGGVPEGKIIEIYGFEGCGKTTLALELSKYFKSVYYIDYEHELDMEYVGKIGANLKNFIQPSSFEEGVDSLFHELKDGKRYDLVIIDTIGSAITNEQIEKDISESTMGSLAHKVTIFLRKAEKICKPLGMTIILLNHKKDLFGAGFGEQHYTPGGRQIKYSASLRLSITQKKDTIYDDAIITNIWIKKNKVISYNEIQNCFYTIRRGLGIIKGEESFRLGSELEIIKKEGQMFLIGSKKFRGKKEVIDFLNYAPEVRNYINEKWYEKNKH
jgi:recombination protein RecA